MRKTKLTSLRLTIPPISNQEAFRLRNDKNMIEYMKNSDFYMIGAKRRLSFQSCYFNKYNRSLNIYIYEGDVLKGNVCLVLSDIVNLENIFEIKILITKDKLYLVIKCFDVNNILVFETYFSVEELLWHRSHESKGIYGLDNYRELSSYELLYVGIAKEGDSYERLIKNAHKKRMDILSNEKQRGKNRVSDEVFLFLFELDPLFITRLDQKDGDVDFNELFEYQHKKIVADAEKAFVSLLKPNYNEVVFKNYPKGKDGLYHLNLDAYGYLIAEDIVFNTNDRIIKGYFSPFHDEYKNADCIIINNDSLTVFTQED